MFMAMFLATVCLFTFLLLTPEQRKLAGISSVAAMAFSWCVFAPCLALLAGVSGAVSTLVDDYGIELIEICDRTTCCGRIAFACLAKLLTYHGIMVDFNMGEEAAAEEAAAATATADAASWRASAVAADHVVEVHTLDVNARDVTVEIAVNPWRWDFRHGPASAEVGRNSPRPPAPVVMAGG